MVETCVFESGAGGLSADDLNFALAFLQSAGWCLHSSFMLDVMSGWRSTMGDTDWSRPGRSKDQALARDADELAKMLRREFMPQVESVGAEVNTPAWCVEDGILKISSNGGSWWFPYPAPGTVETYQWALGASASSFVQGAPVWRDGRGLGCALLHGGGDCRDFCGVSHGLGSCSLVPGVLLGGYLDGVLVGGGYERVVRVSDELGAVLRECLYRLKHVDDVGLLDSRGGALLDTCLWVLGEVCGEVDSGVLCRWRPAVWAPGL